MATSHLGLITVHVPEEDVVADLIFVHGLNGHAYRTWTKDGNDSTFWPGKWLPKEPGFRGVRIHTFGYMSKVSRFSVVNIVDFSSSLLAAVADAPTIPRGNTARIIFVGHSMGGLVIKKAYILGHHIPEFRPLVDRVFALFFLATPHQGSKMARTLNRIISATSGSLAFAADLSPRSTALETINEEFPRYSNKIQLFTFWEAKPMGLPFGSGYVVEKSEAVMNYANERRNYLDADHRDVARYSSPQDPSYQSVRNALAGVIDDVRQSAALPTEKTQNHDRRAAVNEYLGVTCAPDDYDRLPDCSEWLFEKDFLAQWRKGDPSSPPRVLWLCGVPGSGKSVMAGQVVRRLRADSLDFCVFSFDARDDTKATVNAFLRSMAWQMAMLHPEILDRIGQITLGWKEAPFDTTDRDQVWRHLFLGGILKTRLGRRQYWVIDAVDECRDGSEFMTFLACIQDQWPLSILVISRTPAEMHMRNADHEARVRSESISNEDVHENIYNFLFFEPNTNRLPTFRSGGTSGELARQVLQKSESCFLWAHCVYLKLCRVHTSFGVRDVINNTPPEMTGLYQRILDDMSHARSESNLSRAVLMWAAYAFRPLSIRETQAAVEIEVGDTVDDIARCVAQRGGNFAYLDSQQELRLLHSTAKEFFARQNSGSSFVPNGVEGHSALALVCLRSLMDSDRNIRNPIPGPLPRLREYASVHLFQHLGKASLDDKLFVALTNFFRSGRIPTLIEYIAARPNLNYKLPYVLFHAKLALADLLSQHPLPSRHPQEGMELLQEWAGILERLSKHSLQLGKDPHAVHDLTTPPNPPGSAVRQQSPSPSQASTVQEQDEAEADQDDHPLPPERTTQGWQEALAINMRLFPLRLGRVVAISVFLALSIAYPWPYCVAEYATSSLLQWWANRSKLYTYPESRRLRPGNNLRLANGAA